MQTIKQQDELQYLEVSNTLSSIKIALQGAHIFDFRVKGQKPLLFLSETSHFKRSKAIRGGIPICWPWFGPHPSDKSLPNHGFARISVWKHVQTTHLSEEKTQIVLSLKSSPETLALWPYDFELSLEIIMSDVLKLNLKTKNTGKEAFSLTQALHTYLLVEDINTVKVDGLDKKPYYNKLDDSFDNIQEGTLTFIAETDRVYQEITEPLILQDKEQNIEVETLGSDTVVIWNPGKNFTDSFSDLHDFRTMLCIESANALKSSIILEKDEVHTLSSSFRVKLH